MLGPFLSSRRHKQPVAWMGPRDKRIQSVRKLQNKMALLSCEIVVRGRSCSLREESFLVESCSSETFFPPSYEHLGSAMWSAVYLPSIPRPTFLSGVRWFVARMIFFDAVRQRVFCILLSTPTELIPWKDIYFLQDGKNYNAYCPRKW